MNCLHEYTKETIQTFKNGTKHIRVECDSCGRFLRYKPQNIENYKLWFGQYKGQELKDVPLSYLNWYVQNGSDNKVIKRIKLFLEII